MPVIPAMQLDVVGRGLSLLVNTYSDTQKHTFLKECGSQFLKVIAGRT